MLRPHHSSALLYSPTAQHWLLKPVHVYLYGILDYTCMAYTSSNWSTSICASSNSRRVSSGRHYHLVQTTCTFGKLHIVFLDQTVHCCALYEQNSTLPQIDRTLHSQFIMRKLVTAKCHNSSHAYVLNYTNRPHLGLVHVPIRALK